MSSAERQPDSLTLRVGGRPVLPVRAIPFLTGWVLSPDELASQLARLHGPPFDRLRNTDAYHLVAGKPVRVRAREWRQVVADLEALERQTRASNPTEQPGDDPVGYATWLRQAVSRLPAGVFIYRDEFERDFAEDWNRVLRDGSDSIDDALSYAPMALRGQEALVFEGFGPSITRIDDRRLEHDADESLADALGDALLSVDQGATVQRSAGHGDVAGPQALDDDEALWAARFDPVPTTAMAKMFPAVHNSEASLESWRRWSERAKKNGLEAAKVGRGLFNPYLGAKWFMSRRLPGWDWERCLAVLGRNLPARSAEYREWLTGKP